MEIKFKENSESSNETKLKMNCEICNQNEALYTCPRCNIHYCNLKCYQNPEKHINCSENFYQEQVIQELKQCKLDDLEDRNKMVRILKENIKELESESILPEEENENHSDNENQEISEEELMKAYQNEIAKWSPWWRQETEFSFIEIPELTKFNRNLVKNAHKISITNASPLIGDDIVQLFYIYSVIASVYQLNEIDKEFNEEIVLNMLQIDKLAKSIIPSTTDLKTKIDLTFKLLLQDMNLFLRDYIDKKYLLDMLNEIDYLAKSPLITYNLISNLYNSFEMFTKTSKKTPEITQEILSETPLEEKPINVFHFNKTIELKVHDPNKRSRVEIIYNKSETETKPKQLEKSISSIKEAKLILKRLEFYFKWFQLKQIEFRNSLKFVETIKSDLVKEYQQFDEHKEFMEQNLNKLRANIKRSHQNCLIEEISK